MRIEPLKKAIAISKPETPGAEIPKSFVTKAYNINNIEKKQIIKPITSERYKGPAENEVIPLINSLLGFLLKRGN